jgi:hypothetical protein
MTCDCCIGYGGMLTTVMVSPFYVLANIDRRTTTGPRQVLEVVEAVNKK